MRRIQKRLFTHQLGAVAGHILCVHQTSSFRTQTRPHSLQTSTRTRSHTQTYIHTDSSHSELRRTPALTTMSPVAHESNVTHAIHVGHVEQSRRAMMIRLTAFYCSLLIAWSDRSNPKSDQAYELAFRRRRGPLVTTPAPDNQSESPPAPDSQSEPPQGGRPAQLSQRRPTAARTPHDVRTRHETARKHRHQSGARRCLEDARWAPRTPQRRPPVSNSAPGPPPQAKTEVTGAADRARHMKTLRLRTSTACVSIARFTVTGEGIRIALAFASPSRSPGNA